MLFRKMMREVKWSLSQFVSIFLMIFMGILIFTGLAAVGQGMDQSSKKFYQETNLADTFFYGENFTKEEVLLLEQEKKITNVERRLQVDATLEGDSKTIIQLNVVESNQISANHLVEGEAFDLNQDGIWLDSSFAHANNIAVGDAFSILVQGEKLTKTVKGLIMNPEYVYVVKDENEVMPDHKNYGYAFLSSQTFPFKTELVYSQILVETDASKTELDDIKSRVFENKQVVLVMREDQPSVAMFKNEVAQMKAMQAIFPIAFLLIAILTTLTTMTRITVNQRTQIGSLKALGFSNARILRHYMSYGVFIGTTSGLLGLILGPVLLPALVFGFQKTMYSIPEWKGSIEPSVFLVVMICIICCGLSGFFACHKELQGVAAQILRPKAPKTSKHTRLEKTKWWNNLKFDVQWNVRDLLRNKLRSMITVLGIFGCTTLIICAFGLKDTVQKITDVAYSELNTYETKVNLSKTILASDLVTLQKNDQLQFIQETAIEMEVESDKQTSFLTIIGKGDYIKQKGISNKYVTLPSSGIAITNKIAKKNHLEQGDMIKWRIYGTKDWTSSKIQMVVRNPISQGIILSEEAYQASNQTMIPTSFVTNNPASSFTSSEFSSVQSKQDLISSMNTLMETMNVMVAVLIFAAVILGVVVLYNLGVLSFHERIRELTTLKVLGFQYKMLRKLLQMQNLWLTILGTLFGVPGGYLMLSYMLRFMGDSFDMQPYISFASYAVSILGTLLLSVIVSWFLSRKLRTIDMVSALKSVE